MVKIVIWSIVLIAFGFIGGFNFGKHVIFVVDEYEEDKEKSS